MAKSAHHKGRGALLGVRSMKHSLQRKFHLHNYFRKTKKRAEISTYLPNYNLLYKPTCDSARTYFHLGGCRFILSADIKTSLISDEVGG